MEFDRLRVYIRVGGSGHPTILLLHGFAAATFTWDAVFDPLCAFGTVVAYDQPGFGHSGRPLPREWNGRNPYALDAQADLVVELLDRLGAGPAILIAHSAGGAIAVQTSLRHPHRIDSLVLEAPALLTEPPPPRWLVPLLRGLPGPMTGPALVRGIARFADYFIERSWRDPARLSPEVRQSYLEFLQVEHWDIALWQMSIAERGPRLARRLGELSLPTLVVSGDADRIVPTRQSIRVARRIPNARLALILDCGHIPHAEAPEQFLAAVIPFLRSRRAALDTARG